MTTDVVETLILDLLEWVASGERSRNEVLDVWRTSRPRNGRLLKTDGLPYVADRFLYRTTPAMGLLADA